MSDTGISHTELNIKLLSMSRLKDVEESNAEEANILVYALQEALNLCQYDTAVSVLKNNTFLNPLI